MNTDHLSIKEAAERYQKAEITIRRFVRSIVQQSKHEDRNLIQPSIDVVHKLKKQRKPFSYSINKELLERSFAAKAAQKVSASPQGKEYLDLLRQMNDKLQQQLTTKDEQIRALNQALDALSERQRETNILMKGLQEQFLLTSGPAKVEAIVAPTPRAKASANPSSKKAPAKKNSWWSTLWQ